MNEYSIEKWLGIYGPEPHLFYMSPAPADYEWLESVEGNFHYDPDGTTYFVQNPTSVQDHGSYDDSEAAWTQTPCNLAKGLTLHGHFGVHSQGPTGISLGDGLS